MASLAAIFSVCLRLGTRQRCMVCRVPDLCRGPFCLAHGKSLLCRVLQLCRVPVLVAHGKPCLCRVPDVLHTANVSAHDKRMVSGSVGLGRQHEELRNSTLLGNFTSQLSSDWIGASTWAKTLKTVGPQWPSKPKLPWLPTFSCPESRCRKHNPTSISSREKTYRTTSRGRHHAGPIAVVPLPHHTSFDRVKPPNPNLLLAASP